MRINPIERLKEKLAQMGLWQQQIILSRNELLKHPDTTDTRIFLVEGGSLRMYITDEKEEHTIRFAYAGNVFTALDSFFTNRPSSLAIEALKRTRLSAMSKESFVDFLHSDAENQMLWEQILQGLIVQQLEREVDLLTASPAERYLRVLHRSPQLFQEIPNRFIASYLRMTPETLSRLKKS
jgi:CRP-like cAMP-binding protein